MSKSRPGLNARSERTKKHTPSIYSVVLKGFCLDLPENWGFGKIRGILWVTFGDKSGCEEDSPRGRTEEHGGGVGHCSAVFGMRGRWGRTPNVQEKSWCPQIGDDFRRLNVVGRRVMQEEED